MLYTRAAPHGMSIIYIIHGNPLVYLIGSPYCYSSADILATSGIRSLGSRDYHGILFKIIIFVLSKMSSIST